MVYNTRMHETKLVTLDLWNTLINDVPDGGAIRNSLRVQGIAQVLSDHGHIYENSDIRKALRETQKILWVGQLSGKDLSFKQQVDLFLKELNLLSIDKIESQCLNQIAEKYGNAFFACSPRLHKDVKSVLQRLKKHGLKVALVSNTGATPGKMLRVYLSRLGILDYFDLLVFSDEHQIAKPNPELFNIALKGLETMPEQSVHVGDQIYFDCDGAKQAGMQAILLDGIDQHVEPSQCIFTPDTVIPEIGQVPHILSHQ